MVQWVNGLGGGFCVSYRSDFFHAAYDVTADGERFVMVRESDSGSLDEELIVVENWLGELRAKAGNE